MNTKLTDLARKLVPNENPLNHFNEWLGLSSQGTDRGFTVTTTPPLPVRLANYYLHIIYDST